MPAAKTAVKKVAKKAAKKTTTKKAATPSVQKKKAPSALQKSLLEHFGFEHFKGAQEDIISSILSGKDTFVIMPTGGGKSLCYQLPALLNEGVALIVSPLIAL